MRISNKNRKRYIKRVLLIALKKYCYMWLGETPYCSSFNLKNAVNRCSKIKMNQIKQYIYEKSFIHDNAWFVYDEIKNFEDIKDLLYYLAPKDCYDPESTLLHILRNSKGIKVVNKKRENRYYLRELKGILPISSKEMVVDLKIYILSYVELLLIIKKRSLTLDELYNFFCKEEVKYNTAKNNEMFLYLKERKEKSIDEILNYINDDDLKQPDEIFQNLIKHDYKRFRHIIDDYYGSKKWAIDVKFKAYLKLFDIYKSDKVKANKLGKIVLKLLEKSNLNNNKKRRLRRLIKRNMKGGC